MRKAIVDIHESEPIDIRDPVRELCSRLGLELTSVGEMIVRPHAVVATVYKTNEAGSKYLDGDVAATETRSFKVTC